MHTCICTRYWRFMHLRLLLISGGICPLRNRRRTRQGTRTLIGEDVYFLPIKCICRLCTQCEMVQCRPCTCAIIRRCMTRPFHPCPLGHVTPAPPRATSRYPPAPRLPHGHCPACPPVHVPPAARPELSSAGGAGQGARPHHPTHAYFI